MLGSEVSSANKQKGDNMLRLLVIVGVILLILWLLGLLIGFIAGPLLWILLVIGIILLVVWLVPRVRR